MSISFLILFVSLLRYSLSHDDFPQYCQKFGYPVEVHEVTTEDGYILKVFRIQAKGTKKFLNNNKIIYLQHGIFDSSDTWIINSDPIQQDTAFFFADQGYDVWAGNNRGNYYSRDHIKLNPDNDKKQFFDYSFKEMGKYDLPAIFSYIDKFNPSKINYVGHSQGTSQMFYALTQNIPEIENKLENFFALAPIVYMGNMSSPLIDGAAKFEYLLVKTLKTLGFYELLWRSWLTSDAASAICGVANFLCSSILSLLCDKDPKYIDEKQLPHFMQYMPSGSSTKSIEHYAQLYKNNKFQDFDYGSKEENNKHYGSDSPPQFLLSNIKQKIYGFAGDNDELSNEKDVARLKGEMGDNLDLIIFKEWGHASFIYGKSEKFLTPINDIIQGKSTYLRK